MTTSWPAMHWTALFLGATYLVQILLVVCCPVPSGASSREMLLKLRKHPGALQRHPAGALLGSLPKTLAALAATVIAAAAWLLPAAALVWPHADLLLWPFAKRAPVFHGILGAGLLAAGNLLTLVAVRALKTHVRFHPFGETTRLYTSGIYAHLRNPITAGLGLIFIGFVLCVPSAAMLAATAAFWLNAEFRIRMEEKYLAQAFGDAYQQYRRQVGKYFPKLWRT